MDINFMELKTIKLNIRKENLSENELIPSTDVKSLIINHYWDSHGDLHPFPVGGNNEYQSTYNNCNVRLVECNYDQYMNDRFIDNITNWNLYINGKLYEYEIYEYNCSNDNSIIVMKNIVGWG